MKAATLAAALAATLCAGGPALADPLVKGLRIRQVDRAFKAAASVSGTTVGIAGVGACGPGEPGFFCSYDAGNGLVVLAGAPSLKGEVDSLEIRAGDGRDSQPLRRLLRLMVDVVQPKLPAARREGIFRALVDAIPQGSALVEGDAVRFSFSRTGGEGLVFNAQRPFE